MPGVAPPAGASPMPRSDPPGDPDFDASGAMMRLITAGWAARLVHTAAELRIADHLGEPRDAAFLASVTSSHAPSLARLLRALAAIGVLREGDDRTYTLTPLGATLRLGGRLPDNGYVAAFADLDVTLVRIGFPGDARTGVLRTITYGLVLGTMFDLR